MKNLGYLLALHSVDGLGTKRLTAILNYFKDPKVAWSAPLSEIKNLGIPEPVLEKLKEQKKVLDPEKYFEDIVSSGIKILTYFDPDYPKLLKEIPDYPLILYYKGEFSDEDKNGFGVVGTRKITGYGRAVTEELTAGLAEAGFTIISGLARGVDTIAHQSALKSRGRTLAVLGGGIKTIFPPENTKLASEIEQNGAYLSEFPPTHPHLPGNFPARNRIIAGLSKAVLVTEAAEDSGSLITANLALEYNREVFAVPGPITSTLSKGPADLIKNGATLVFSIDDILENLGLEKTENSETLEKLELSEIEKLIMDSLENEQKHIDEICRQLKKPSSEISGTLIKLEINGLVKSLGGGTYTR